MAYRQRKYRAPMKYFVADGGPWNGEIVGLSLIPNLKTFDFYTSTHEGYYVQNIDKTIKKLIHFWKYDFSSGFFKSYQDKTMFKLEWVSTASALC
jgi:hypothetical protein